MSVLLAGLVMSLGLTCWSIEPNRFYTWWTFAPWAAAVATTTICAAFSIVSVMAVLTAQTVTEERLTTIGAITAMAGAQAAARRMGARERGGTLIWGFVLWLLENTDNWVVDRIERHCRHMPDADLLNAGDQADTRTNAALETTAAIEAVTALREARERYLSAESPQHRAAGRTVLAQRIAKPWMTYRMGPFT